MKKITNLKKYEAAFRLALGLTLTGLATNPMVVYADEVVYEVTEGSAAEEAGIKKGDVITKFDGESVTSSDDLIDKIRYYGVGEKVKIEVQTANNGEYESREVEATLKKGTSAVEEDETEEEEDTQGRKDREDDGIEEFSFPEGGVFEELPFNFGDNDMF